MNKLKAVSYMQNAISFIFLDPNIKDSVNSIHLFGSAVRNTLTKDSDIDIFIDCKNEKFIENVSKTAIKRFYNSKDYEKWKLLKFTPLISIQAGILENWQLKSSILSEGVTLYSKEPLIQNVERKVIFILKLPKDKKNYLHLIRNLYGRREKGYNDLGLLNKLNGEKVSTNIIILPKEHQQNIVEFLNNNKIDYTMKEICIF